MGRRVGPRPAYRPRLPFIERHDLTSRTQREDAPGREQFGVGHPDPG